jgi:hypothetical protein
VSPAAVWQQWGGVLLASAIGLPLAGALVAVLVRARRRSRPGTSSAVVAVTAAAAALTVETLQFALALG